MACVIPFPARQPTAKQAVIDLIKAYSMQTWDNATTPIATPASIPREDEILKLLRRIDRRLARLDRAAPV